MNDDEDDRPTPRVSGSWSAFEEEATGMAARLENCADAKSIPTLLHAYDHRGATEARRLARALRLLAERFHAWPTADEITVALERPVLTGELMRLCREGYELIGSVPKSLPPRG